jgi:multicomponent Na+:H+ antiporter subunit B
MKRNPILREITNLLVPPILLFALYVQFHGDFGPGGGFQAGVIFAAGIILYALIYGLDRTQRLLPLGVVRIFISLGLLLYAGVGVVGLLLGGNYLDYNVLAEDPVAGQHLGILLIELGVGITVASVMIAIFYTFAARRGS